MAKVTEVNPHLNTKRKLDAGVEQFVVESSAIEGIKVKPAKVKGEPKRPTKKSA